MQLQLVSDVLSSRFARLGRARDLLGDRSGGAGTALLTGLGGVQRLVAVTLAYGREHGLQGLAAREGAGVPTGRGREQVELHSGRWGLEAGDADAGETKAAALGLDGLEQATGRAVDLTIPIGRVGERQLARSR